MRKAFPGRKWHGLVSTGSNEYMKMHEERVILIATTGVAKNMYYSIFYEWLELMVNAISLLNQCVWGWSGLLSSQGVDFNSGVGVWGLLSLVFPNQKVDFPQRKVLISIVEIALGLEVGGEGEGGGAVAYLRVIPGWVTKRKLPPHMSLRHFSLDQFCSQSKWLECTHASAPEFRSATSEGSGTRPD